MSNPTLPRPLSPQNPGGAGVSDAVCEIIRYDIFMAGNIGQAKQVCREYCFAAGLCVTIEPVDFIYTGGEETGFRVGLINYPRFPSNTIGIETHATNLAEELRRRLYQHSYSIVGGMQTRWTSTRGGAA